MNSPQLENGYTRIANALYEAIIGFPLTGYQQRVLHAIIRKTYGFGKKSDKISLSQLSELTKVAKPHVCRAIKELRAMNIVTTAMWPPCGECNLWKWMKNIDFRI